MRINEEIKVTEVRVINHEGEDLGAMSVRDAQRLADNEGLDLVEVAPDSKPPVCKILDYGKLRYQQQKKAAIAKKKQKVVEIKEVVFRPNIDENDFQVKLRNVRRFLESGNKVKITLRYRGRELSHREIGEKVILRIKEIVEAEELGKPEFGPKLEGRNMLMILAPAASK